MTSGIPASQPDHASVIDDWRTISEELLQGLVHALNNRVAALSAFVELAKLGDEEGDPLTVLPTEIAQLHRVNALFGLLPERRRRRRRSSCARCSTTPSSCTSIIPGCAESRSP